MYETVKTRFGHTFPEVDEYDPRVIAFYWEAFDTETGDPSWGWIPPEERDGITTASGINLEDFQFYAVTYMTDDQVEEAGFDPR